ncbi:4889d4bb-490d-48e6-8ba8-93793c0c0c19-CDS [Sclerotinia trifoliorum]|uniref:4889d4bb-490d-48e6-8ba8-93793c0c0c19-CDS n=1 Tax=Sclerotinia trifoliorum TaxID=28548 RepID=A0A8H2ZS33_9HELO|nr:4889d4bb-490d-48e6-8ba8-93793c0c0c19-CDS [Sclerotinia trifoliorum]
MPLSRRFPSDFFTSNITKSLQKSLKMNTSQTKIPTRIMIISDTHTFEFNNRNIPFSLSNIPSDIDILLHCGDLTKVGGLSEYRAALQMLKSIPAKLKLVIAGNHDRTLDKEWVVRQCLRRGYTDEEKEDALRECEEGNAIMRGDLAGEAGVTYLEEGVHGFVLRNGARARVYASPYTPEFCGFGWAYERERDRFNGVGERKVGMEGVDGAVRIPGFEEGEDEDGNGGNVDIVMTHGPPMNILDKVDGYAGHVGCVNLFKALTRAKPRLFCCGHIHEGHGAEMVSWGEKGNPISGRRNVDCQWPDINRETIEEGKQTLMVNASIMDVRYRPVNKPWFVELDLPRAKMGESELDGVGA